MTQDKFIKRNEMISQHLERIAAHRGRLTDTAPVLPASHAFRELLIAQERLLLAAERMLDGQGPVAA